MQKSIKNRSAFMEIFYEDNYSIYFLEMLNPLLKLKYIKIQFLRVKLKIRM